MATPWSVLRALDHIERRWRMAAEFREIPPLPCLLPFLPLLPSVLLSSIEALLSATCPKARQELPFQDCSREPALCSPMDDMCSLLFGTRVKNAKILHNCCPFLTSTPIGAISKHAFFRLPRSYSCLLVFLVLCFDHAKNIYRHFLFHFARHATLYSNLGQRRR